MVIVRRLRSRTMRVSRAEKLRQFFLVFSEGMTVLDVGVSPETQRSSSQLNFFLKHFPFSKQFYTGLAVEDISAMNKLYPGKGFVQYSGAIFPFKDREFDWAFSNAVIEHVGLYSDQLMFLNEMLRVANRVFFTTPNKYFPIEVHTYVPFIHWNDWLFYWLLAKKNRNRKNLNLFSLNNLKSLLICSDASEYKIMKNRIWGLTMTFTVMGCNKP